MINPESLNQEVKMFKNGNTYAFRISEKDCEFMKADEGTEFEKIVSPDGKEITFKKVESATSNILEAANNIYDEHEDIMKRLENL
ncbi:AbrB family transcriptional regulator [Companilactobacillus huachuanensis]|uniref:AbrB family transcriptional regulator n=1 Tax=Companilactobacillus huachuanensis TaxID=2559914 RepID=A0ABW1RJN2_9LACO|nr:AbrB family transcriptional regulator [Companilactobacillus huachuanensis]